MLKTCSNIANNKCYGEAVNLAFASYHANDVFKNDCFVNSDFYASIRKLTNKLTSNSNKDYYNDVVFKCQSYFPSLDCTHG